MKKIFSSLSIIVCLASLTLSCRAQEAPSLSLPEPDRQGGKPLMNTLNVRHSSRSFSSSDIPLNTLSNLLWAACGINREDGRRTAPSAHNWQQIDIYVALKKGLYLYNAGSHSLDLILTKDIRESVGIQAFTQIAPVNFIYVADYSRMSGEDKHKQFYAATDTGFISQNVYLACASEGLATVVLGWVDKPRLEKAMGLGPDKKVILTQPVGYPGTDI